MRVAGLFLLLAALLVVTLRPSHATDIPRTVLALYDSRVELRLHSANVHRYAAMPLNHLGLVVEFHDIAKGLPDPKSRADVRGILYWRVYSKEINAAPLLDFLEASIAAMKHVVVIDGLPWEAIGQNGLTSERIQRAARILGWQDNGDMDSVTFDATYVHRDPDFVDFERKLPSVPPALSFPSAQQPDALVPLKIRTARGRTATPVIIGRQASYIAPGYALGIDNDNERVFWLINPFAFFQRAFDAAQLPKPDTTTLAGRRIYYSHIDGDGWQSISQVRSAEGDRPTAIEALIDRAIEPFPDLPVAVAPVAAELDPEWQGTERAQNAARRVFALPQVEAASHSWSHPFRWSFFENYRAELERRSAGSAFVKARKKYIGHADGNVDETDPASAAMPPRAFSLRPFSLSTEIGGSLEYIARFAPPERPPRLIQWSGDNIIFPAALAEVKKIKALAINGGDTRFDADFPSHAYVSAIGYPTSAGPRIYASNSNENTYTNLWTDRFFAFSLLPETWARTGQPRRLKPMNLYYHAYSGEKIASLNAVVRNLEVARKAEIIPIEASRFAAIAEGFFSTRIEPIGVGRYRIRDRGALQTIRFDDTDRKIPDITQSRGVIGYRHELGALYVALDEAVEEATIALTDGREGNTPSLVQSRWRIFSVQSSADRFAFTASGFGAGEMAWRVMPNSQWRISATSSASEPATLFNVAASPEGIVALSLPARAGAEWRVVASRQVP